MKRCAANVARLLTARRTDMHDGALNDVPAQTQAQPGCHNNICTKTENICTCTWREKASAASLSEEQGGRKKFQIKCMRESWLQDRKEKKNFA